MAKRVQFASCSDSLTDRAIPESWEDDKWAADDGVATKADGEADVAAKADGEADVVTKVEEEAYAKALARAKARAEAEDEAYAKAAARAEARAKAEEEAYAKADARAEARAKAEEEAYAKAEARAKARAAARAKAEEEAYAKAEARAAARAKAEEEAYAKAEVKSEVSSEVDEENYADSCANSNEAEVGMDHADGAESKTESAKDFDSHPYDESDPFPALSPGKDWSTVVEKRTRKLARKSAATAAAAADTAACAPAQAKRVTSYAHLFSAPSQPAQPSPPSSAASSRLRSTKPEDFSFSVDSPREKEGFSFASSSISSTYTEPGPGPWGNRNWIDSRGMKPPALSTFTKTDWTLFYEVTEKLRMGEKVDTRTFQCVQTMKAKRIEWLNRLPALKEEYYARHAAGAAGPAEIEGGYDGARPLLGRKG